MAKRRLNNEGSIHRFRDRWRVSITLPNKKRSEKVFKDYDEALEWRNSMLADIDNGRVVIPSNMSLGEWGLMYIETYCKPPLTAQKTYERYLQILNHLEPISTHPIQSITETQIRTVINNAQAKKRRINDDGVYSVYYEPASQETKRKIYRVTFQILKKAASEKLIKLNPLLEARPPRIDRKKIQVFTKDEIAKIISGEDKRNPKMLLIVKIGIATGMRMSEITGLQWEHFNEKKKNLSVEQTVQQDVTGRNVISKKTKTKSSTRIISISEKLVQELASIKGEDDEFIVCSRDKTPIKHSNFAKWWRAWLKSKGVPYKNFHVVRHTHATELIRAGVPIMDVSRRLGHSLISTTLNTYSHALESDTELAATSEGIFGI